MAKIDPLDQPTLEVKERTFAGAETGWSFAFNVPPVTTQLWTVRDWIVYIGGNWFRVGANSQG